MVLYLFTSILILLYIILLSKRTLHMLQQNLYNENNRYINWVNKNFKITVLNYSLILILISIINLIYDSMFLLILMMIVVVLSYIRENKISLNNQNKKPLVYTKRIKRLIVTLGILYLLPIIIGIIFGKYRNVCLLIVSLFVSFGFYTNYLALIINMPIEKAIYKHFENKAKEKLKSMPNLKTIGITGSYGKTSCKNILNDILSIKYNTLPTPKSLNTFNGLMITINNNLTKFDDVFIAEMGAYVKGEINGLCDLVNPKYGIITSIGTAHLATFGSEENIQQGKMELIEHLPHDGIGVLNADDPKQVSYKIKNKCKILWVGIDNKNVDVKASNIKTEGTLTTFDVQFKGDKKKYKFETKLLGKHNVYNILSALALGYEFKIPVKDLILAVKRVKTIQHRLEIKKFANFYQIDDAYNSNPVGAKSALDVLSTAQGYKIVVTPGMIELGDKEKELNKEFGKQISKVADLVILIGKKQTEPILDGLKEEKFPVNKIQILNDVRESYAYINNLNMKEDIYALYENDLPDTYNE